MNQVLYFFCLLAVGFTATARAEFEWTDTEGEHLDLAHDGRPVARYVYEPIDESSPERREETYKPFCHLYQPGSDDSFITKGPGGKFTHHRGVFYGFSKISYTDEEGRVHKNIDTWHCRQAHQVHRKFVAKGSDEESAHFTSLIDWIDNEGNTFAQEERTMRFSMKEDDVVVDFESTLTPTVPSVRLDGDPQHAGFQFRAHNDVNEVTQKSTYYIRPGSGAGKPGVAINWSAKNDTEKTRDLPWKALCFVLDKKTYTVCYLDHPTNPKPARHSERQYGRFGSYFATDATPNEPLSVQYRLVVRQGEMEPEEAAELSREFVGQ
ncbi:MAG: DUF6807 family protein [Verrucomicrobiales bacterium]